MSQGYNLYGSSSSSSGVDYQELVDDEGESTALVLNPTHDILSLFLLQVILILVIVRLLAKVLAKLKQPPVIGEILAGVVLGPSVLGYIPGFESSVFPAYSLATLNIFAQIGLIFFMFFLGLELDPSLFFRYWRSAFPIAIVSVLVPFGLGCSLSPLLFPIDATVASHSTFTLFIGTSLAFTAFPLLARILTAFRLLDTPFGEHVLSIAAIDDVLAWCTLALTLSYAGGGTLANGVYTALITIAYLLVLIFVVRPALHWLSTQLRFRQKVAGELNRDYVCVLLLCPSACSIWTEITGIHAFFGAFTFGLIVPKDKMPDGESVVDILAPKIELLIVEFFLPLYFAYSGLRTTLGALNTGRVWGISILVIIVASLGKIIPVTIMTRVMTLQRGIGDDFEQEDLDWEEEQRRREQAQSELTVKDARADKQQDELEMAEAGRPSSFAGAAQRLEYSDNTTDYSYQVYQTPAHKQQLHSTKEEKEQPSSSPKSSPTGADSPTGGGLSNGHVSAGAGSRRRLSSFCGAFFGLSGSGAAASEGGRSHCYSWRTCLSVGLLMNTTGLVTLIALNIGLDRHILGPRVFSMLVLMALVTTFTTSPFFHWLFYLPFVYERNLKREARRKQREIQQIREQGADEDAVGQVEDRLEAERVAREQEEEQAAQEEADSLSISSKSVKRRQPLAPLTPNAPYSTNQVMHHILNPDRDILVAQLLQPPASEVRHSLTPPPAAAGRRHSHSLGRPAAAADREAAGDDDDGGQLSRPSEAAAIRISSSDGELHSRLRSGADPGSDVYSNGAK